MPTGALAETLEMNAQPREMRILVVDDSELDRQRVLRLCTRAGLAFNAVEVATVDEMKKALDAQAFDLVFIDYLLSGETGIDAVDALATHPNQSAAAAIMIAGEGQIDIAVDAMRRGCSDYLTKSQMTVDTLQKSIATALERRMLIIAVEDERAARIALEQSIRDYANTCRAGMQRILARTLRRVRKLRGYSSYEIEGFVSDIGMLEKDIDQLWDTLPDFRNGAIVTGPTQNRPMIIDATDLGPA